MPKESKGVRLDHISKIYKDPKTGKDFYAVHDVSLDIQPGSFVTLLGPSGCGKTTTLRMVAGFESPDEGEIYLGGEPINALTPNKRDTAMVFQSYALFPHYNVFDNVAYGLRLRKVPKPEIERRVKEILELVEIMRNLTREGKSVILITHKLKEIKECADKCTIIRQGKYISTVNVSDVTEHDLASMMVGRNVEFTVDKAPIQPGETVLSVRDLHARDYRKVEVLRGLSIDVRRGEIVGIAGIDGNGQTELVEILTGLKKATHGSVTMNGQDAYNKSPRYLYELGISSIPADRQKHGLILDFSVEDNLILQNYEEQPYSRNHLFNREAIFAHATQSIQNYDIRPQNSERRTAGTLSGGNQQKVIIAREVQNDKDLLIAVNPTRGLDVGAIEYVHKYIVEQRNKGKAVLLVSFELDEIMSLSDKIDVIFDGRIVASIPGEEATENQLGLLMAGGKVNG